MKIMRFGFDVRNLVIHDGRAIVVVWMFSKVL